MRPEEIKKRLSDLGVRQVDVVVRLGMKKTSRPIVSTVINGYSRSRRVEKAISEITGEPLSKLWPDWYPAVTKQTARRAALPTRVKHSPCVSRPTTRRGGAAK